MIKRYLTLLAAGLLLTIPAFGQRCLEFHKKQTPNIVGDWMLSLHSQNDVDCSVCHGDAHKSSTDVARAQIPTPDTCAQCHEPQACQTCHNLNGDHGVITGWGFQAVRLPLPEDKQWAADRMVILQALGVLDPAGQPTGRLDVVKAGQGRPAEPRGVAEHLPRQPGLCPVVRLERDGPIAPRNPNHGRRNAAQALNPGEPYPLEF